jgi:hypothetical protein
MLLATRLCSWLASTCSGWLTIRERKRTLSRWQDGGRDFAALVRLYLDAGPHADTQADEVASRVILGNADLVATVMGGAMAMAGLLFKLEMTGIVSDPGQMLVDYARLISGEIDEEPQEGGADET